MKTVENVTITKMLDLLLATYLGIFLTALYFILCYQKSRDLPPGPWNLPIVGSLPWLDPQAPHLSLANLSQKYGPLYGLRLGSLYTVVVSDAKLLKKIMLKEDSTGRGSLYLIDTVIQGKGILFTDGELWKENRKIVMNFLKEAGASKFSPNRNHLQNQIIKNVDDFIEYVEHQGDGVVNLEAIAHNVASVFTLLFLGKCWQREDKFWKDLLNLFTTGSKLVGIAGPLNFLPILRFLPKYRNLLKFIFEVYGALRKTNDEIINETKTKQFERDESSNLIEAFLKKKQKEEVDNYTNEHLSCLLLDMFAASIDAVSTSIAWLILHLAKYPQVQEKMRQELNEMLREKSPRIEYLANLPFTEATIAEVARIRTIVPLGIPHYALEDIVVDEFKIPKGASIMPLLWGIHMDPNLWGDPEKFRPERFLDGAGRYFKPEAFVPFQTGKRECIGKELGKMVIFSFIATIVKKFKIESEENEEIDLDGICGLSLSPKPQNVVFEKI